MPGSRGIPLNNIPARGDPDRKRALNVLAQRRYRQRKRERLAILEGRVRVASTSSQRQSQAGTSSSSEILATPDEGSQLHHFNPSATQSDAFGTKPQAQPNGNGPASAMSSNAWCTISDHSVSPSWRTDEILPQEFTLSGLDTTLFSNSLDLGAELQALESSQFTFPDDTELEVPALQVMNAGTTIAQMLGREHLLWDPNASGVFDMRQIALTLPSNLEPTETQKRIPHHPLFDILPWPSVRTRLICVFSQPPEMRPPAARDPLALLHMIYDIDDPSEGFRVSGPASFDDSNWEIGQAFFRNWWWALDRAVVEQSNALRAKRGAGRLQLLPP